MKHLFSKSPVRKLVGGFTLIEVMITLGIATMFVVGVITFTTITFRQGIFAIGNYTDLNNKSRRTLDVMSRDIRCSSELLGYAYYYIRLTNSIGANAGEETYYIWDGANRFTQYKRNPTLGVNSWRVSVLLTNCDYLQFNIYQRNPTNNFSFVSVADSSKWSQTKLIDVSWRCSRSYLGSKLNTESVQTARIVMRN